MKLRQTVKTLSLLTLLLSGCSSENNWKFGFISSLSGGNSDLGHATRNGMLLAVEERNLLGGIDGRQIDVLIKDDKLDPKRAAEAARELIAKNVEVIIGPATSAMAEAVIDIINEAQLVTMATTVTSNDFSHLDDYFFRVLAPTSVHAALYAKFIFKNLGASNVNLAYDLSNKSYTISWRDDFIHQFEALGGKVNQALGYETGDRKRLVEISKRLVMDKPGMVIFITSAVDAALLAKLVRSIDESVAIGTAEWAGTGRLIELGGRYVEQAYVPQFLDQESQDPLYLSFKQRYYERFKSEPGFPSFISYEATSMVIEALSKNPDSRALRQTLKSMRIFRGSQGNIYFDEFGDALKASYMTQIINGRYRIQESP